MRAPAASEPAPTVARQPAAPPPPPPTPTPQAPPSVTVSLATTPPGAEVLEGRVTIGTTPLSLTWPRGEKRTYTFALAGHQPLEKTLKPEADETFTFALEPARKPTSAPPKPPSVKAPPKPPADDISAFE
ncbi:MAG: PEGA domain-containing protein [Myxococcaceae bacterium]|nr:PEGA domain-containing protein [Myxococcaceae bacterium]